MGWVRGGGGRLGLAGGAVAAATALFTGPAVAFATSTPAGPTPPAPSTTTTSTLPSIPAVNLSVTDGQPAAKLFANAVALSSAGTDNSALQAAVSLTQAKLDADATAAQQAQAAAAAAAGRAERAERQADAASREYASTLNAAKRAAVFLYMSGPEALTVSPEAGATELYAQDYAESAFSPYGVLFTRRATETEKETALRQAAAARKLADSEDAKAAKDLAGEQAEAAALESELSRVAGASGASSAEVAADHLTLARQAGAELVSANSLQFTPKTPIPPPVSTTSVALAWAFAELGKPYLWGGTGPNAFDCSGLTQFVWRAAGVSIPRVAADQYAWTIPVPLSDLLPGDLVFFGTTDIHHVGIYIGDGLMINAPYTGTVVQVSSIWWSDLAGFGRVHAAGVPVPPHGTPTPSTPAAPAIKPSNGPVPSQTKPPPGWHPTPGSTTPIVLPGIGIQPGTTTTTATVPPAPSTSAPTDSTTTSTTSVPDGSTTTTTSTTSTTLPGTTATSG